MKKLRSFEKWFLMEKIPPDYFRKTAENKKIHEKFSFVERSLCGMSSTDMPVSHFDFERIEKKLFRHNFDFFQFLKKRSLTFTALASALCALIISIISFAKITTVSDEFLKKGNAVSLNMPKLYVFCISPDKSVRVLEGDSAVCGIDSELQFALSNPEKSEFGYLFITGTGSDGRRMWYYPEFGNDRSVEIRKNAVKEPFGSSINISSNHIKGTVNMTAVFSTGPLSYKDISKLTDGNVNGKNVKNIYIQFFSFKIK